MEDVEKASAMNNVMSTTLMGATVPDRFETVASLYPDSIAVEDGDVTYTYRDLDRQSKALAANLACQSKPKEVIGVCMPASAHLALAMISVMRAGLCYLPLDPSYPIRHLLGMAQQARISRVIIDGGDTVGFSAAGIETLSLDDLGRSNEKNLACSVDPSDLAYIMFTSGSTGRPKGAMISHKSIVNYLDYLARTLAIGPGDRVLQIPPISFDPSIRDILGPLCLGATVIYSGRQGSNRISSLADAIVRRRPNVLLSIIPTILRDLLHTLDTEGANDFEVRLICTSGEPFSGDLLDRTRRVFGNATRIVNQYGPTETTMTCCWFDATRFKNSLPGDQSVPIGTIIPGVSAYVLNDEGVPVNGRSIGDLYIGGVGLGLGYVNAPGLTAVHFLPNPFVPGERMYRTGDQVEVGETGQLLYRGRADWQIKVLGQRIEPHEIENALLDLVEVKEVVVVAHVEGNETITTACFVCDSSDGVVESRMRRALATCLPETHVPTRFLELPALPRLPSGKVDRRSMHKFCASNFAAVDRRRDQEGLPLARLKRIWADALLIDVIDENDNFFELGGTSVTAIKIIVGVQDEFGVSLPMHVVFDSPTIFEIWNVINQELQATDVSE